MEGLTKNIYVYALDRIKPTAFYGNPDCKSDDHLRNHSFLLTDKGWTLSPAYDINSNPDRTELTKHKPI